MKLKDFLAWIKKVDCTGEEEIVVHAFGGMRHGKAIVSATLGFDWDAGKILMHPEVPLFMRRHTVIEKMANSEE